MAVFVFAAVLLSLASAVTPVVIVPGDGSNQLEARLDKPSVVSFLCSKKSDWYRLWLDTANLLLATSCWADNIKLVYDEATNELKNNIGVETRVPDFGGTSALEELDPGVPFDGTAVFGDMVKEFTSRGHVKNETLRGAPYDFRYAPSSNVGGDYIERLKHLIEDTAKAQGGRVSLVSHSMGCLQVLYMLNHQTQAWKDQYVEKWIPLAGPWGGVAQILRLHASGDNQGLPVKSLKIRQEQRSYETNFWLAAMPRWWGDQVIIRTPSRDYTAQDYDAFFEDIGFSSGKSLMRRVTDLTSEVKAPGVDVVCMYSLGVDTPLTYTYGDSFDNGPEKTLNGDGDGTVNDLSLCLCDRWTETGAQTRSARVGRFSGISHADMLKDESVLAAVRRELGLGKTMVTMVL